MTNLDEQQVSKVKSLTAEYCDIVALMPEDMSLGDTALTLVTTHLFDNAPIVSLKLNVILSRNMLLIC